MHHTFSRGNVTTARHGTTQHGTARHGTARHDTSDPSPNLLPQYHQAEHPGPRSGAD